MVRCQLFMTAGVFAIMRSVIVSGVGDGIGAAVVRELHRTGHKVVVVSRGKTGADLASELSVAHIRCDLTDELQVSHMVDEAAGLLGSVDALVHTAGGYFKKETIENVDSAFFTGALLNNALTFYNTVRSTVGYLRRSGHGSIVAVSAAPNVYLNGNVAYAAGKGSVHFMVKQLAAELLQDNITVNGVSPGFFNRGDGSFSDKGTRLLHKGRLPTESIAKTVSYLLDNPLITGQLIEVDGGHSTSIQSGL